MISNDRIQLDGLPRLPPQFSIDAARKLVKEIAPIVESHGCHVARLSLALFDRLSPLHGLGTEARLEICCAAILHDIGISVAEDGHNKHSRDLILERFWVVDSLARRRIAMIARYHRKSLPLEDHKFFDEMDRPDREKVWAGLSILRIADGLDRTHRALAHDVTVEIGSRSLQVGVRFWMEGDLEIAAAEKKADGLFRLYDKRVVFLPFDVGWPLSLTA